MVALYELENFLLTYWFMREVLPTLQTDSHINELCLVQLFSNTSPLSFPCFLLYPLSPRIITFNSTFLLLRAAADKVPVLGGGGGVI